MAHHKDGYSALFTHCYLFCPYIYIYRRTKFKRLPFGIDDIGGVVFVPIETQSILNSFTVRLIKEGLIMFIVEEIMVPIFPVGPKTKGEEDVPRNDVVIVPILDFAPITSSVSRVWEFRSRGISVVHFWISLFQRWWT